MCGEGQWARQPGVTCLFLLPRPHAACLWTSSRGALEQHPAPSRLAHSGRRLLWWPEHPQRASEGMRPRAWLDLRKPGWAGRSPCSGGQGGPGMWTRKLWSLLPHLPHAPTHVWAPRQGTRSFPLCWGQASGETPCRLRAGAAAERRAAQPMQLRYFALPLHLSSSLSASPLHPHPPPRAGEQAAGRPWAWGGGQGGVRVDVRGWQGPWRPHVLRWVDWSMGSNLRLLPTSSLWLKRLGWWVAHQVITPWTESPSCPSPPVPGQPGRPLRLRDQYSPRLAGSVLQSSRCPVPHS